MTRGELVKFLEKEAVSYRVVAKESVKRNYHMNEVGQYEEIPQKFIDAILVDFINHLAIGQGMDYGLYTKHLINR